MNKELAVEERNDERIKLLKKFCKSLKLENQKITNFTLKHIHIDHRSKTLYCFVPKVNIFLIITILLNANSKPQVIPTVQ